VPGGWDNRTFRLGARLSVRLPSAAAFAPQVEKEHRWLPILASHLPLPIPEPLAMGAPGEGYPWPWSVRGWLDGAPMSQFPAEPAGLAHALAAFLAALHRIEAAGGPPPAPHNFHRGGSLAVYDAETRAALAALAGRIETAAAAKVWDAALGSAWASAPVWVHGDVAPGNLLVRDGRLSAVIDFGSMAVGDPACDLAIAWTHFTGVSRDTFRAVLPLDPATWARGRGWALWKALITAAGHDRNQREAAAAWHSIETILAEP
jgi:aminoglycoside phosphotransferase (APT) family kinase protein